MKVYETIISYLDKAIERIEFMSVAMTNKDDNNAYRLLSSENADGIQIPLCLYRDFLGLHGFPLGTKQQEVVEVAEELGEAWSRLFDAIGQRIRKSHEALEEARSACNRANESLIVLLQSKVGSEPTKNAKSVVRKLNSAIANLSTAMRRELASPPPPKPGSVRKDDIRLLAVSLMKGFRKHCGGRYADAEEAVRKVLWQKFDSLGLACSKADLHQLRYNDKFKHADAATEDKLREHDLL